MRLAGARVTVTGGNGFLARHVIAALQEAGAVVRATTHSGADPALRALGCEVVAADVRDPSSLRPALAGSDAVVHAAGVVSIAGRVTPELRATNVDGTRNVIDACRVNGVERLLYVSSVHAMPEVAGGAIHETERFDPSLVVGAYAKTKAEATALVRASGLDCVIVHPSGLVGRTTNAATSAGCCARRCRGPCLRRRPGATTSWTSGTWRRGAWPRWSGGGGTTC